MSELQSWYSPFYDISRYGYQIKQGTAVISESWDALHRKSKFPETEGFGSKKID